MCLPACDEVSSHCGEHMVYDAATHLCFCDATSVPVTGGCKPCVAGHEPQGGQCACPAGTAEDASGVCVAVSTAQGAACDATNTCDDAVFDVCGPSGYCTHGCQSNGDCEGGYNCASQDVTPTCRKPPTGLGTPCSQPADCAGFEASFCESVSLHQCTVISCNLAPNDCAIGWGCCDLRPFGAPAPMCLPAGACPNGP